MGQSQEKLQILSQSKSQDKSQDVAHSTSLGNSQEKIQIEKVGLLLQGNTQKFTKSMHDAITPSLCLGVSGAITGTAIGLLWTANPLLLSLAITDSLVAGGAIGEVCGGIALGGATYVATLFGRFFYLLKHGSRKPQVPTQRFSSYWVCIY